MKIFAFFTAPVVVFLGLVVGVVVIMAPVSETPAFAAPCLPQVDGTSDVELDDEQWQVAQAVVEAGRASNLPPRGWVIGIATGLQESGLRPLPYGDRDSIGVFQQRTPWGPVEARMDPYQSALMFFTGGRGGQRGLLDIPGWEQMPLTDAAQAVQVSGFPTAYAKWEPLAVQIVSTLTSQDGSCATAGAWVFPLADAPMVLTAGFGQCGEHWADCHTGQDFAAPTGTPVVAASDGVVTFAGVNGAYGAVIRVLHADGVATWYAHLSQIEVLANDPVKAGQVIGLVGATGNTTGPHLHFEVRTGATATTSGTPIDPLGWLQEHDVL